VRLLPWLRDCRFTSPRYLRPYGIAVEHRIPLS
jgi:hypothetical protein